MMNDTSEVKSRLPRASMFASFRMIYASVTLGLIVMAMLSGCSGSSGPQRYEVSGSVTYDGKPVPKGFVTFYPDSEEGNSGPGGGAEIRDGVYRTAAGKGVVGGPHRIRIIGFDGIARTESGEELADGASLFTPYESSIDFPKADTVQNFEIPSNAVSASGE
tara:strand:+ start:152079 stop:152564 length:486 start_codon:yes stop_codon:yes gene_type:complete